MRIRPLRKDLIDYLQKRALISRFNKQSEIFEKNPFHPGLHTELLEPKHVRIYSFRIARKWRAIFIYTGLNEIEIIDINNHYL